MYLNYIQQMRAIAILFVLAWHTASVFSWAGGGHAYKILQVLFADCSTLMIFISGYIFQHLLPKYRAKKYYFNKFKYILLPYFLVSLPAVLFFVFVEHKDTTNLPLGFYDQSVWLQILNFYLTGTHLAPMWFMPVIFIFFFISPVLESADKTKWFYWLLPLYFVLSFYVWRGLPFNSFTHYFSVFVLGMFFSKHKKLFNPIVQENVMLVILITICLGISLMAIITDTLLFHYYIFTQKIVLSIMLIGILLRFSPKDQSSKNIEFIANSSFSIYLVHSYVLYVAKFLSVKINLLLNNQQFYLEGNILIYIVSVVLVLSISIVITQLSQRIFNTASNCLIGSDNNCVAKAVNASHY